MNSHRGSFCVEKVLKPIVEMVAQLCEHTKNHLHFKWVRCVICKLDLDKANFFKCSHITYIHPLLRVILQRNTLLIKELIAESKIPEKAFLVGEERDGNWEGAQLERGSARGADQLGAHTSPGSDPARLCPNRGQVTQGHAQCIWHPEGDHFLTFPFLSSFFVVIISNSIIFLTPLLVLKQSTI